MISIIISKNIIESKKEKNKVFHTLILADGSTSFVDKDVYDKTKVGQAVALTKKKYQSDGAWRTTTIVVPVNIVG